MGREDDPGRSAPFARGGALAAASALVCGSCAPTAAACAKCQRVSQGPLPLPKTKGTLLEEKREGASSLIALAAR